MGSVMLRSGGPASLVAGVLWLLVWLHQRVAHGTSERNEMRLVAGLTWMDTSKLLVFAFLLVLVGLASLHVRAARPGRSWTTTSLLLLGSISLLIATTALEFWTFPWGSYEVTFEEATGLAGSNSSGVIQALASLLFALALVGFSIETVRAGAMPVWLAPVLIVGGLSTVYLTPVFPLPGIAWLALGFVLLFTRPRAPRRPA